MPIKVVHIEPLGEVTFARTTHSKSIRMRVKPDKSIRVSFPYYVSLREAVRFAEQHAAWASVQLSKMESGFPEYTEDTTLITRYHTVTFTGHTGKFSLKQQQSHLDIRYPVDPGLNDPGIKARIQKILTEILRWEAKKYLPVRLSELATKNGFHFGKVTIRNNTSNWGSCSGKNNISLNLHLMKLPDPLIDLILLHELVHTRVKNHGPEFWKMLDAVTGNQAKQLSKEVKKYSPSNLTGF
jgi:predicted metal-dependent hydrolase